MNQKLLELLLTGRAPPLAAGGFDTLIPDAQVADTLGVCIRTLARWDARPELGFPPPVRMNGRKYRRLGALRAFNEGRQAPPKK